jgi:hypothetical protein
VEKKSKQKKEGQEDGSSEIRPMPSENSDNPMLGLRGMGFVGRNYGYGKIEMKKVDRKRGKKLM